MEIPEYFKEKIVKYFGIKGEEWLKELPDILDRCREKWSLTDIVVAEDLSFNFVCFAQAARYGEVVLKVAISSAELYTEMKALSLYNGHNICKHYDFDSKLAAMLLERIVPGKNLTSLEDNKEQLMVAADLISSFPIAIENNELFPTYQDWLGRAFDRARKEKIVGAKLLSLIDMAERIFDDINQQSTSQVLLHGDLHHWNILQDREGDWKAIDPKGVTGVACMESARFIDNHLNVVSAREDIDILSLFNYLDEMVSVFASKFDKPKVIIANCLFVLCVLSTCWRFEESNPKEDQLKESIDKCEFILKYIKYL